jgi:FkbM family methyltransferase
MGLRHARRRWTVAARLSRLAPTTPARLKVLAALPLLAAAHRVGARPELTISLRHAERGLRLVVGDPSDLEALYEVLVEGEYELPPGLEPRVVLDLGGHIGASALAIGLAYPKARVLAVEPDPASFARLTRNVAALPDVTCLNAAVGAAAGVRPLYRQAGNSWGTSLLPTAAGASRHDVEVCTVAQLLERANADRVELVKIDIEGSEWAVFPELVRLESIELIVGEIHFDGADHRDFAAVAHALPGFDVTVLRSDKYGGVIHARRLA